MRLSKNCKSGDYVKIVETKNHYAFPLHSEYYKHPFLCLKEGDRWCGTTYRFEVLEPFSTLDNHYYPGDIINLSFGHEFKIYDSIRELEEETGFNDHNLEIYNYVRIRKPYHYAGQFGRIEVIDDDKDGEAFTVYLYDEDKYISYRADQLEKQVLKKEVIDNRTQYCLGGKLHRDNRPAVIEKNGWKHWYQYGKMHRKNGPASINHDGSVRFWYVNNRLHRDDGPAIENNDGDQYWYQHGKAHRTDGPAVFLSRDGYEVKEWWRNGKFVKRKEAFFDMEKDELNNNTLASETSEDIEMDETIEISTPISSVVDPVIDDSESELISHAEAYVASENLKRSEAVKKMLKDKTEANLAMLEAIKEGTQQPKEPINLTTAILICWALAATIANFIV